jgi:hypothetical protein
VGTDGWVIFSAWATASAAIATAVMAYLTRKVAMATNEEATQTRRVAQQQQEDRELAWRPVLGLRWDRVTNEGGGAVIRYTGQWLITNVGSGPGINCRFVERLIDQDPPAGWRLSNAVNVSAGGETEIGTEGSEPPIPNDLFVAPETADSDVGPVRRVLFCEDVFGARYRFPIVDIGDHNNTPYPGERHRLDEEDCPEWVTNARLGWPLFNA